MARRKDEAYRPEVARHHYRMALLRGEHLRLTGEVPHKPEDIIEALRLNGQLRDRWPNTKEDA